jgi:hypothetical protein
MREASQGKGKQQRKKDDSSLASHRAPILPGMSHSLMPLPTALPPMADDDFAQQVEDLMRFLQDFTLPPSTHKKKPRQRRPPLTTLPTNDNASPRRRLVDDNDDDDDSKKVTEIHDSHESLVEEEEEDARAGDQGTEGPALSASSRHPHSWILRMTQALREWKEQHWQQTQALLDDQRRQLEVQHDQEVRDLQARLEVPRPRDVATTTQALSTPPSRRRTTPRPVSHDRTTRSPTLRGGRPHKQSWHAPDGTKTTRYADGTCHEQSPDGATVTRFPNGDVQTKSGSRRVVTTQEEPPTQGCYYYGRTGALRLEQADSSVVWCFANGQRERHAADGRVVVDQWASTV